MMLKDENSQKVGVDKKEIGYLHDEVFGGRSVLSGNMTKLAFTCWNLNAAPLTDNIILLTKEEADLHDKNGGKAMYDEATRLKIEKKIREHAKWTSANR